MTENRWVGLNRLRGTMTKPTSEVHRWRPWRGLTISPTTQTWSLWTHIETLNTLRALPGKSSTPQEQGHIEKVMDPSSRLLERVGQFQAIFLQGAGPMKLSGVKVVKSWPTSWWRVGNYSTVGGLWLWTEADTVAPVGFWDVIDSLDIPNMSWAVKLK